LAEFDESPEPPWPLPLHAAIDTAIVKASAAVLNAFFIVFVFKVLVVNNFICIMFTFGIGSMGYRGIFPV
jgi:hypothetical protein